MDERIPIAIVHGSRLIREGMKDLLSRHSGLEVRATFSEAGEILERAPEADHVLVYDVGTAHHEGHARIAELHGRLPQARILMVKDVCPTGIWGTRLSVWTRGRTREWRGGGRHD